MSKILILLSAVLVVSGINADDADDDNLRYDVKSCLRSFKKMEEYLNNTYSKIPDNERTEASIRGEKNMRRALEKIIKIVSEITDFKIPEPSDTVKTPSGEIIWCPKNYAYHVRNMMKIADKHYKQWLEGKKP